MRALPPYFIAAMLLVAGGTDDPAGGCRKGQSLACTCADGSVGTRACGAEGCTCGEEIECHAGETVACMCPGDRAGTKECGAVDCGCNEPGCSEGEFVDCTCANGRNGKRPCGEEACTCVPGVCELRHPDVVDFGAVPPGFTAKRMLVLANDGGGSCSITGIQLDRCDEAFGLTAGHSSATVDPGAELFIPVSFQASGDQKPPCALQLEVAGSEEPLRTVWLSGQIDPECLSVGPAALAFEATCERVAGDVTIDNGCGVPVRLAGLALDGDDTLFFLASPLVPVEIAAGTRLQVTIGYRPQVPGTHSGELRLDLAGFEPVTIPVTGTAPEPTRITDTFQTAPRPQVDVLFVIDNGSSMADDTETLAANLAPYRGVLDATGYDYHLGVTTTGLEPGGGCPGGVGGGEDGRLFPVTGTTPRFVTRDTPSAGAIWRQNLSVGACREGPNQVLEAALRALTPPVENSVDDPRHPEENDGNAGFLRPEPAALWVIAITDRDDESPQVPSFYYNSLLQVKGFRNRNLLSFLAVAGDPETGCAAENGRLAAPADRLGELASMTMGDPVHSICASNWQASSLTAIPFSWPPCYNLSSLPMDLNGNGVISATEGELEVSVNGQVVPSGIAQGTHAWTYEEWAGVASICFSPFYEIYDSSIEVRYFAWCS